MNAWCRFKRLFLNGGPSNDLPKAVAETEKTKAALEKAITEAEQIGRVVELKAQRDVRKANSLVMSTNQAVAILRRAGDK